MSILSNVSSNPLVQALINETERVYYSGPSAGVSGGSGCVSGKVPNSYYGQVGQYQFGYPNTGQAWPDENSNSWNRVFKLLVLSFISTIGSMGSIFIISAITVIDTFQVRGNCYLVCLAFGHLLVTMLVLPASAIAIMANITENAALCNFQWIITIACLVISVLSFFFMAVDNFFGMNTVIHYQFCCTRFRVFFFMLIIWSAGIVVPFTQESHGYGPHFCKDRRHLRPSLHYHPYMFGVLISCTLVTILAFTRSLFIYKRYRLQIENASAAEAAAVAGLVHTDGNLLQSNASVYILSLLMWTPMIVTMVVDPVKPLPQEYLDTIWYLALANSVGYSYMYACTNREFREAFNKLFFYCCCKSHVTFTRKGPMIRRPQATEPAVGLRVHIIPGLNIYNQRRDTSTTTGYRPSLGGGGFGTGGSTGGGAHYHGVGIYRSHVKTCEL